MVAPLCLREAWRPSPQCHAERASSARYYIYQNKEWLSSHSPPLRPWFWHSVMATQYLDPEHIALYSHSKHHPCLLQSPSRASQRSAAHIVGMRQSLFGIKAVSATERGNCTLGVGIGVVLCPNGTQSGRQVTVLHRAHYYVQMLSMVENVTERLIIFSCVSVVVVTAL